MKFENLLANFKVTDLISSMFSMISALLQKDHKTAELPYFQFIADFFKGL